MIKICAVCSLETNRVSVGMCHSCYMKHWREKNRQHHIEYKENYRKTHKEEIRKYNREYYLRNPAWGIERSAIWKRNHKERFLEWARNWRRNNPDRVMASHKKKIAKRAGAIGSFTPEEWRLLCAACNNRCLSCGEKSKMTVDHVIPLSRGGTNYIDNIQPLCHSCNSKKRTKIIDYRLDWT